MVDRNNQGLNKREKKVFRRIVLAIIFLGLLVLLFAPGRGLLPYHALKNEVQTLDRDNKTLQQRNVELAQEIERLKNDEGYMEQLAREKYGMLKKNEEVYQLKASRAEKK